jgi:hypothetical protein
MSLVAIPDLGLSYEKADSFFYVNKDQKGLQPIKVDLPAQPAWHLIDGYGLPPELQIFPYQEVPEKLLILMGKKKKVPTKTGFREVDYTIDDCHAELNKNRLYYSAEIRWIEQQWHRVLYGYWVYINGKATYIDGWHYFYVNFWFVDGKRKDGRPYYRDRDRRWFLFARFCYVDSFCYGFNYPKHRREGATYRCECINFFLALTNRNKMTGIQSMTDEKAQEAFEIHLLEPVKRLPFFFRPSTTTGDDDKTKMIMNRPRARGLAKKTNEIGSRITQKMAKPSAYDSRKLIFWHGDEVAKQSEVSPTDVVKRWQIVKQTLAQGSYIHGLAIHTSTVGEFSKGGGAEFKRICDSSHYEQRGANNQTASGLYNLFLGADDGLDGFVDVYGNSIIEDPATPVLNNEGDLVKIGARNFILNNRKAMKSVGDEEGYGEYIRLFPLYYIECFRKGNKDSGLPLTIINDRLDLVTFDPKTIRGNFDWVGKRFASKVRFIPRVDGLFHVSWLFPDHMQSDMYYDAENKFWRPREPGFTFGGFDSGKFEKTKSRRKSKAAGAIFWKKDHRFDHERKLPSFCLSNKFVCTYEEEYTDSDLWCEQMLMMLIFYNAWGYPEMDAGHFAKFVIDHGFDGYLMYSLDIKSGKFDPNPGESARRASKQELFRLVNNYFQNYGMYENHADILHQAANIEGIDDLTNYDLFAACGYAKKASEVEHHKHLHIMQVTGQAPMDDSDLVSADGYC